MRYSYGDSSESPFTSNFLELLRDAIDFAVYALQTDQRILQVQERLEAQRQRAEAELNELEALKSAVTKTIATATALSARTAVAECASQMTAGCDETVNRSTASVVHRLEDEIALAATENASERDAAGNALLALLTPHVPPESSSILRLHLLEGGSYLARREGVWPGLDLHYKCELAVPSGHPFASLLRIENLRPRLEIGAPEHTGWIKKEVKIRPQHLERYVISEAIVEGAKVVLRVRAEPGKKIGFDFECDTETDTVTAARVVSDQDQLVAGTFELREEDAPKLAELCNTVHASLCELKTTRLLEAKLGEDDFRAVPKFHQVAERIVGYLSPFVREIAKHSLEPDELVLRYPLGDDRREEIFVSKTTLRQKYEALPADLLGLFSGLGLEAPLSRSLPPLPSEPRIAVTRSELPPSNPPPAKPVPPVVAPPPPPPPTFEPEIELVPALQKIIDLSQAGRQDDSFRECAALLERARFSAYDQDEQRKALKVLLALTGPETPPHVMRRAYRAGRDRARTLSQRSREPLDFELLGLCQMALGEPEPAAETFREALELERKRDPSSALCARLGELAASGATVAS